MNISSLSINRPVLATVISIVLGVIGPASIFACDCGPTPSVMSGVEHSQLVIHGKVIHAEFKKALHRDPAMSDSLSKVDQRLHFGSPYVNEYTVVVMQAFKGASVNDTIIIRTGLDPVTDCGLVLPPGSEHLIYAKSVFVDHQFLASDDQIAFAYSTSACTRTKRFSKREAKAITKVLPMVQNVQYRDSY
ncbi:MAG: hypothetical protein JNM62_02595 [Flavobacteriales bacterium]|nr:hypothetical protein [Flavobacteriales bacterium]